MIRLHHLTRTTVIKQLHKPGMTSRQQTTSASTSPSTTDTGFILSLPRLPNPATSDPAYQRVLQWYLPPSIYATLQPRLEKFGAESISDRVHEWIGNAEKQQPYVKTRNLWGERYPHDRLVTSDGWKQVGAWGIKNGYGFLGHRDW